APGANAQNLTHVNLLRTLEDMYALPHAGNQQSLAAAAGFSNAALQANFYVQWTGTANGAWSDSAQWNKGIVPDGIGAVANLLPAGGLQHVVTLTAPVTVGVLNFDARTESYRLV